jgi:formiminotetrahydrofolate cyclodeaminase
MPAYRDEPLQRYLDDAASGQSTPGGGSVAALAGALAACMGSMVGAFTLKSKKCAEHHDEAEDLRREMEGLRSELTELVQADVEAFGAISKAYGMPKESEEEKEARRRAIRSASAEAMEPPLRASRALARFAALLPRLAEIGNRNLVTDTGVAALLCEAAFRSAVLNVRINLGGIGDDDQAATIARELDETGQSVSQACAEANSLVEQSLR